MYTLHLLGGTWLEGYEGPLTGRVVQARRLALLALLACARGRPLSRDKLVALLWPESTPERARHSLTDSLYVLNRGLGDSPFDAVGAGVRLDPEFVTSDVAAFEEALEAGNLERAVGLYGGPFLDGFFVRNAYEFEEWARGERERLERAYASALERLAEDALAKGEPAAAATWLRRQLELDPCSGPVAARLIEVLAMAGGRAEALRVASAHVVRVREELLIEPDPSILELVRRLREALAAAPSSNPSTHHPASDRNERADLSPTDQGRSRRPATLALGIGVVALLGLYFAMSEPASPVAGRNADGDMTHIASVAVLPLANLSGDPEQEYFADGMTDAVIDLLARGEDLVVLSKASVTRYKDTPKPAHWIARELGADAVVEGSVLRAGDRVQVAVSLRRATEGRTVWSHGFEGPIGDVLALQAEVARAIAEQIGVSVAAPHPAPPSSRPVRVDAYDAYLKGVYFSGQGDLELGNSWFQRAIEINPDLALARANLAHNYYFATFFGFTPSDDAFPRMKSEAVKALSLEEALPDAHAALGLVKLHYEWRWNEAEAHFRRALEINPSDPLTRHHYAHLLLAMRRSEESVAQSEQAARLHPFDPGLTACLGWHAFTDRQYERAIDESLNALRLAPGFFWPHLTIGWAYEQRKMYPQAIASLREAVRHSGGSSFAMAALGHALAASGNSDAAEEILTELLDRRTRQYVSAYDIAALHAGLGQREETFRWLRQAYDERATFLVHLGWDPRFDTLRSDPRLREFLVELGLPTSPRLPSG